MNKENNGANDGLNGFDDGDGASRLIKGTKLKFTNDFEWVTDDDTVIAADREFLAIEVIKTFQKWIGDRPVETHVLPAHEKLPDIDALNKKAPREEWREKFGKEVGPWEWAYVVYLLDPQTMQIFTFPTGTVGGSQAVRELRETVGMARRLRGENLYPRVRLGDTFMPTGFGGRQRPHFEIVGYEILGATAALPVAEPKQIEAPKPADPLEQKTGKTATPCAASKSRKDPDLGAS
jgi:hypothetical protein